MFFPNIFFRTSNKIQSNQLKLKNTNNYLGSNISGESKS